MRNSSINLHLVFNKLSDAESARDAIDSNAGLPKPDIQCQRMIRKRLQGDTVRTSKTWAKIRQRYPDGKYYFRKASIEAMGEITPRKYNYTEEEFDPIWTFIPEEQ